MNQMLFLSSSLSAPTEGQQGTDASFSVKSSEQGNASSGFESGFSQLVNQQIDAHKEQQSAEEVKKSSYGEATSLSPLPAKKEVFAASIDFASMTDEDILNYLNATFPQFEAFFSQLPDDLRQSFQSFLQGKELSLEELQSLQAKLTQLASLPIKESLPVMPEEPAYQQSQLAIESDANIVKVSDELKGLVKVLTNEMQRMSDAKRLSNIIAQSAQQNSSEPLTTQPKLEPVISDSSSGIDEGESGENLKQNLAKDPKQLLTKSVINELVSEESQSLKDTKATVIKDDASPLKATINQEIDKATKTSDLAKQPSKFIDPVTSKESDDADIALLEQSHRRALVLEKLQNYLKETATEPSKQSENTTKPTQNLITSLSENTQSLATKTQVTLSKNMLSEIAGKVSPEIGNEVKHSDVKQVVIEPIKMPHATEQIKVQIQQTQQKQQLSEQQLEQLGELSDVENTEADSLMAKEVSTELKRQFNASSAVMPQTAFVPTSQSQTGHTQVADTSLSAQTLSDFDANVAKNLEANLQRTENAAHVEETISILKKDFPEAMKEKALMMINLRMRQVDIRLDPPELGSMQVKLNMQGEQAQLSIVVQSQAARDVLEQQMPRLRELLSEQGVDLGETHVKQGQQQQQDLNGEGEHANNQHNGQDDDVNDVDGQSLVMELNNSSASGIDYYA